MMLRLGSAAALLALSAALPAPQKRVVHRVTPTTPQELTSLRALGVDGDVDWWRLPSSVGEPADVHLVPGGAAEKTFHATSFGNATVLVDDLDALIRAQQAEQAAARARSPIEKLHPRAVPEFYLNYEETILYMRLKAGEYSDICTVSQIGTSFEGRPIYVLRVHGNNQSPNKPELYMQAVLHAREWITAGSLNWILAEVLESYGTDPRITRIVDEMDLSFNLVANPDGYQHSHTPTGRLWRKNRMPNPGSSCIGTDPNRNWPSGWGGGGASTDPCSDAFRGSGPASTNCVRDILAYVTERAENIRQGSFYDIHSFGNFLISPSGFTTTPAPDYPAMAVAMSTMCDAITPVHGTPYRYGSIASWFGVASGGSIDTTYTGLGIIHSYAAELRDTGQFGFLVPFNQVTATAQETIAGVIALAEHILDDKKA